MRTLYLPLTLSLILHTLILFNLPSLAKINLPATKPIVLTIGTATSGSLDHIKSKQPSATINQTQPKNPQISKADSQQNTPLKPQNKTLPKKPSIPLIKQTQTQQDDATIESLNYSTATHKTENQGEGTQEFGQYSDAKASGNTAKEQVSGESDRKITAPKAIYAPVPAYPSTAEKFQQQGTVQATVQIDLKGQVIQVKIKSSGFSLLDNAAKKALKSWRFDPAKKDGIAIPATTVVNILFNQDGVFLK